MMVYDDFVSQLNNFIYTRNKSYSILKSWDWRTLNR